MTTATAPLTTAAARTALQTVLADLTESLPPAARAALPDLATLTDQLLAAWDGAELRLAATAYSRRHHRFAVIASLQDLLGDNRSGRPVMWADVLIEQLRIDGYGVISNPHSWWEGPRYTAPQHRASA